jgi:hypothetical protein
MKTSIAVLLAALLLSGLVASCATLRQWQQATPTETPCAFIERCRNPTLTGGGN